MPTNRRRRDRGRLDALTDAQEAHLCTGFYFFDFHGEDDHFRDEAHRRRAWALHRDRILKDYDHAGRRPVALWEYDLGPWEQYGSSEEDAVYQLLKSDRLEPITRNGAARIMSEIETIEKDWRHEISFTNIGTSPPKQTISQALPTYGCPPWFYNQHAPEIIAQQQAETAAWRARRSHADAPGQNPKG
jgi:hypothetical protein